MSYFSDEIKQGQSQYVKLDEGQTIVGAFLGQPFEFKKNFKLKKEFEKGQPIYPEGTTNAFKVNFLEFKNGAFVQTVAIFAGSAPTAIALDAVITKYGQHCLYEITRTGTGTKTKYPILFERKMTPEETAMLEGVKLIELKIRAEQD